MHSVSTTVHESIVKGINHHHMTCHIEAQGRIFIAYKNGTEVKFLYQGPEMLSKDNCYTVFMDLNVYLNRFFGHNGHAQANEDHASPYESNLMIAHNRQYSTTHSGDHTPAMTGHPNHEMNRGSLLPESVPRVLHTVRPSNPTGSDTTPDTEQRDNQGLLANEEPASDWFKKMQSKYHRSTRDRAPIENKTGRGKIDDEDDIDIWLRNFQAKLDQIESQKTVRRPVIEKALADRDDQGIDSLDAQFVKPNLEILDSNFLPYPDDHRYGRSKGTTRKAGSTEEPEAPYVRYKDRDPSTIPLEDWKWHREQYGY